MNVDLNVDLNVDNSVTDDALRLQLELDALLGQFAQFGQSGPAAGAQTVRVERLTGSGAAPAADWCLSGSTMSADWCLSGSVLARVGA